MSWKCPECNYPNPDNLTQCFQCQTELEQINVDDQQNIPLEPKRIKLYQVFLACFISSIVMAFYFFCNMDLATDMFAFSVYASCSSILALIFFGFYAATKPKSSQETTTPMSVVGLLLIITGVAATFYFFFAFDTSVSVPGGDAIGVSRVNNIGLMSDRQNGILIGFGGILFGSIMRYAEYFKRKQ